VDVPTAVLDACVLYPAPLRDLLMHMAVADLFRARWSRAIHDEWIRNVLADRPDLTAERLDRTRQLMDAHAMDAVVTGYESLVDDLTLPDPGDRHVLAAAIRAGASVIVTYNLKDFPAASLVRHGIEARHPDAFVADLLTTAPDRVAAAIRRQRTGLKNPAVSIDGYLALMARAGLVRTVEHLTLMRFML
jgi:hypothetical protein